MRLIRLIAGILGFASAKKSIMERPQERSAPAAGRPTAASRRRGTPPERGVSGGTCATSEGARSRRSGSLARYRTIYEWPRVRRSAMGVCAPVSLARSGLPAHHSYIARYRRHHHTGREHVGHADQERALELLNKRAAALHSTPPRCPHAGSCAILPRMRPGRRNWRRKKASACGVPRACGSCDADARAPAGEIPCLWHISGAQSRRRARPSGRACGRTRGLSR